MTVRNPRKVTMTDTNCYSTGLDASSSKRCRVHVPPQSPPCRWRIRAPSEPCNPVGHWAPRGSDPNGISIGSSVSADLTVVTNTHTQHYSVCSNRPRLARRAAMRPDNINNNNNNSHDNVYRVVIMTKVIARIHPVHLMNVD